MTVTPNIFGRTRVPCLKTGVRRAHLPIEPQGDGSPRPASLIRPASALVGSDRRHRRADGLNSRVGDIRPWLAAVAASAPSLVASRRGRLIRGPSPPHPWPGACG